MARSQVKPRASEPRRQTQASRPQGVAKRSQQPLRSSARLADTRNQGKIEDTYINSIQSLPSPPTSNALKKETPQHSSSSPKSEPVEVSNSSQESEANRRLNRSKRKRSQEDHDLASYAQDEPTEKRTRNLSPGYTSRNKAVTNSLNHDEGHPIEHWIEKGYWPKRSFSKDFMMSQPQLTKKRSSSAMSYSQGVKEGIHPAAHTPIYEKQILRPAGIVLSQQIGKAAIGDDARKLCRTLLNGTEIPNNSNLEGDLLWKTLDSVRSEGEGQIVQLLASEIAPSPSFLSLRRSMQVDYLEGKVGMNWKNAISFAGPTPCPDLTVGFCSSAFAEVELDTLRRRHNTPNTPSNFTGDLYFPFFTCEAKCGASGLNESDRQNARSAATAINTVLEMYRHGEEGRQEAGVASQINQLHREVLYFSISHDHTVVKIFGHYPLLEKDKTYFHQHIIKTFDLSDNDGGNRYIAYNFVCQLYDHFAPNHLQRIRDAIQYLPEPRPGSSISLVSTDGESGEPNLQEAASTPTSQNTAACKKPRVPQKTSRMATATATSAREQQLEQDLERQRQEFDQRFKQEKEESEQRLNQEKKESKQRHEELMDLIFQQRQDFTKRHEEQKEEKERLIQIVNEKLG